MIRTSRAARRAFTLLELMVALAISMMLLAALYVAVDVQWSHGIVGRARVN